MLARLRREEMMKAGLLGFNEGGYPARGQQQPGMRSEILSRSSGPPSSNREAFLRELAQNLDVREKDPYDSYGYDQTSRGAWRHEPDSWSTAPKASYESTEHFGVIRRRNEEKDVGKSSSSWVGAMGLEKSLEPVKEAEKTTPNKSRYGRPPLLESGEGPPPAKISRYGRPPLINVPYGAPPPGSDKPGDQARMERYFGGSYDDRVLNYVPPTPVVVEVGAGRKGLLDMMNQSTDLGHPVTRQGLLDSMQSDRPNLGNWESQDFRRRALLEDADESMQRNFSQHLMSGFGWRQELDLEGRLPIPESIKSLIKFPEPVLNSMHPAYQEPEETVDGPENFEEVIEYGVSLYIFDKSYETSLWDYDPKFTWDYIPGTKRGSRPQDLRGFLYGVNYTEEENSWRRWERTSEKHWKENFVPKVREQQIYIEAGLEPPEIHLGKKRNTEEPIQEKIMKYMDENIILREDMCTAGYCGICDVTFQSVLPSVMHYGTTKHEKQVKNYFIDTLWDHGQLTKEEDMEKIWFENLMNRIIKKYRTKPTAWKCTVCNVDISSATMASTHFKGSQHQRRAKGLPAVEKMHPDAKKQYEMRCVTCCVKFDSTFEVEKHCSTEIHIQNVYAAAKNNIPLPPGPSSRIGRSKQAKTNWKAQKTSDPPAHSARYNRNATTTGANTMPLGNRSLDEDDSTRPDFSNLFCAVCSKTFLHPNQLEIHMMSTQHNKRESDAARRSIHGKQPAIASQKKHIQMLQKSFANSNQFAPGPSYASGAAQGPGPAKKKKTIPVPSKAAVASVFGTAKKKGPTVNLLQKNWVSGGIQQTSTSVNQNYQQSMQWRGY